MLSVAKARAGLTAKTKYRLHSNQKSLIFPATAVNVAGKHSIKAENHRRQRKKIKECQTSQTGNQTKDKVRNQQRQVELIRAVSAAHKIAKPVHAVLLLSF